MEKLVNKIFRRYGVPVLIQENNGESETRGFIQHTATSARRHLLPEYSPLGELPPGHYLMLLPLNRVSVGTMVMHNRKWYIVRRVEPVWLGNTAVYDWCLCEERGEMDLWGR